MPDGDPTTGPSTHLTAGESSATCLDAGMVCSIDNQTGACTECGMPEPACKGFQWIGQSFASCNECGQPFWEHTHDTRMKAGAGPFDKNPFEYVLITEAEKAACRAKWDR